MAGLIFYSTDKETEIRAFGSPAIEDFDQLEQEYSISSKDINLTYKLIKNEWSIFSGITRSLLSQKNPLTLASQRIKFLIIKKS